MLYRGILLILGNFSWFRMKQYIQFWAHQGSSMLQYTAVAQAALPSSMLSGAIQNADYPIYSPAWHRTRILVGPSVPVFLPIQIDQSGWTNCRPALLNCIIWCHLGDIHFFCSTYCSTCCSLPVTYGSPAFLTFPQGWVVCVYSVVWVDTGLLFISPYSTIVLEEPGYYIKIIFNLPYALKFYYVNC